MAQEISERPAWQVRISASVPGADGGLAEAAVPSGGGVWIGGRWVLTCAHVIGPEPVPVMARFSFAGGEPIPAVVAPRGWLPGELGDLALLELDRDPPSSARPAPLRPARSVTGHACAAYGYPAGYGGGVWSNPEITGHTASRLQLTARAVRGHQIEKGFSGAGLFDRDTGAVVGLVAARDTAKDVLGGFAIPMQRVVEALPQLGPWVGWRVGTDPSLRRHWRPRARGVYEDTTPGWYFTGRIALLRELTGWLEYGVPGRAVRVVTGPAGSGKSALLAWLCAVSDPQLRAEIRASRPGGLSDAAAVPAQGRVKAAVWARDLDADGACGALAAALALPVPAGATTEDVLAAVRDLDPGDRDGLVVVVDALDEARKPREIARRLLVPLARDLGVKVLAGTRPGRDDELLEAFGDRAVTYRLDVPAWFDRQDLVDYAAACLRADFAPAVLSGYRAEPGACGRVAAAIADAAGSNFLVAGLAARARAEEPVIDADAPGWRNRQRFPAEVGQAFADYLSRFGDDVTRARDLLRVLAYAEGAGIPAGQLWADMASALAAPRRYGPDDLAWLLDSAAAYLIESGDDPGRPVVRLFHQALIEYLRPGEREAQRQRALVGVLMGSVPSAAAGLDWGRAPAYVLRHLAAHAAAAGQLDTLLGDPAFLVAADPVGLLPLLDMAKTLHGRQAAWIYGLAAAGLRSGSLPERAANLQLAAGKAGHSRMAESFGMAAASWHWTARVLHWEPPGRYTALGRSGFASASALTITTRGEIFMVTGADDGAVTLWRVTDDQLTLVGEPRPAHDGRVTAAVVADAEGRVVAITVGERDGTVALWRVTDDGLVPAGEPRPVRAHGGAGIAPVAGGIADGRVVALTGGIDGVVALWRAGDDGLAPAGKPLRAHAADGLGVTALAAGQAGGQAVAVTSGRGAVALWRVTDEGLAPAGEPAPARAGTLGVTAVAVGEAGTRAVAVTCGSNGTVALWWVTDGGLVLAGEPQPAHVGVLEVTPVAVGQAGGRALAVTGGHDGTVALWWVTDDGLVLAGEPERGHGRHVAAVAVGQVGGRDVAVTHGHDGTVALWRISDHGVVPGGERRPGHVGMLGITQAAVGLVGGGAVAITGGDDGMVALWRVSGDRLVRAGEPRRVHGDGMRITAVAVGETAGRAAAVTGDLDGGVALWWVTDDGLVPAGTSQRGNAGHVAAVAVGEAVGRAVAVTGEFGGGVALWWIGDDGLARADGPREAHGAFVVTAVAVGQVAGQAWAVTGGDDGTVALWRVTGDGLVRIGEPRPAHHGTWGVAAVAVWEAWAVTGGHDGTVALWRVTGDGLVLVGEPRRCHVNRTRAVAIGEIGGRAVTITGGGDGTVALWPLGDDGLAGEPRARIPIGSPPLSIALLPSAEVIVWSSDGVLTATMPVS